MLTNTPVAPTVASMGLQPKQTTPTRSTQQPSKSSSQETLPGYPEAKDGCVVTVAEEKAAAQEAYAKSTTPKGSGGGKMATLKSILSGRVQRHHPMYALERAVVPDESRSSPSQSRT